MRTRVYNNKEQVFCEWRHRWVRLTPEEWVRQQLLHRMVEQLGYPASLIAVEIAFQMGNDKSMNKKCFRADAVVYDNTMSPLMIIECKAETVAITQRTLDQAVNYNRLINVPWLLLHNGHHSLCVHIQNDNLSFSDSIPTYSSILIDHL